MKVHQKRLLDKGKIEKLVGAVRSIHTTNAQVAEKIRTEADYFERNTERMHYPKISPPALVYWLGRGRSWLQDGNRFSSNVLLDGRRESYRYDLN